MSRNKNIDYTQYIHPFIDENGVQRFIVAKYYLKSELYRVYFDKHTAKRLRVDYIDIYNLNTVKWQFTDSYFTRRQALRRARYLFGGK